METKQHATKEQMGQRSNQRGNQKISLNNQNWKQNTPKSMGCSKSSSKKELHSDKGLPQETRKISNNLTYVLKDKEKEEQT